MPRIKVTQEEWQIIEEFRNNNTGIKLYPHIHKSLRKLHDNYYANSHHAELEKKYHLGLLYGFEICQ